MNRNGLARCLNWLLFLGPWLAGFLLLVAIPFGVTAYWSFCRHDLLSPPRYVGLDNYERLLGEALSGERFGLALRNTAYYAAVSVPGNLLLALGLALLLSKQRVGQTFFRAVFYVPSVIPVVATSILWLHLLDPQEGWINAWLMRLGLPAPGWFNSPAELVSPGGWLSGSASAGSKDALALMGFWGIGNLVVIYLAALVDVPKELYEATTMEGGGAWARFRHVTWPRVSPVVFFNLIVGCIQAVSAFTQIYLVSDGQGSPAGSSLVLSLHLFLAAFKEFDVGYASAAAWSSCAVMLGLSAALFRSARFWVHYRGGAA